ncbi:tetratricopeptide repeat protein [Ideonella sp. 4Y11]|uniref:Tetratricopeptide repeat protein n=1 Tax=Ideonella aquatica TaxID=2824119 RepID=A0A941BN17_9BURK|nr:winged helix-turn-helix domain-containing protein [Ideonella aquatica]MBQ0961469.1 tetratricopeptide repeat protein [Ideonella aquatica]
MSDPTARSVPRSRPSGGLSAGVLRCGDFVVDLSTRRLRSADGAAVAIGSRAFDLLLALIEGHGQPVPGEQLRARVWPRRVVADNNLRVQLTLLRRLLGREAVAYLPGLGYRLTVPIEWPAAADDEPTPAPGHLPEILWPLLGREGWMQRLDAELRPGARLSLVAAGGIGKTSLALALAHQGARRFADGAWWVDLTPLRDPQELPRQVAAALGLPVMRERALDQLGHALSSWSALLVLDNCEHLRAAACELADRLLRVASGVGLLVTSRVALGCAGEQLCHLPPLDLPGADAPWSALQRSGAVQLFETRTRAADQRFRLRPENAQRVAEICRQLDGNAFAITLAAAQVPVLGLQWVHDSLEDRLNWRHRQPAADDDAPHHRSLAATLDWSCALLREPAQRLLRRLGVTTGSVAVGLVEALAAAAEPLRASDGRQAIEALVAHGLLALEVRALDGTSEPAYVMHGSVRLYAREQLQTSGEWDAAHEALARWLSGQLGGDGPLDAEPPPPPQRVQQLSADVQVAVAWAARTQPDLGVALVRRCIVGWRRHGQHALAMRLSAELLANVDQHALALRFLLLEGLCGIQWELEHHDQVFQHAREMQALLQADQGLERPIWLRRWAQALAWQAHVLCYQQGSAAAVPLLYEALAASREGHDGRGLRQSLANLGWYLQDLGQFDEAHPLLVESLQLSLEAGDDWGVLVALENLGELELHRGRPLLAIEHFAREAELARRVPDLFRRCQALVSLVQSQLALSGEPADRAALLEALVLARQHGFLRPMCHGVSVLALLQARSGQPAEALATLVFSEHLHRRLALPICQSSQRAEVEARTLCADTLSAATRRAAQARGELLELAELISGLQTPQSSGS